MVTIPQIGGLEYEHSKVIFGSNMQPNKWAECVVATYSQHGGSEGAGSRYQETGTPLRAVERVLHPCNNTTVGIECARSTSVSKAKVVLHKLELAPGDRKSTRLNSSHT